jgi:hypothetical protein
MFPVLRIVLIVLVILLGAGAAMWRTSRYVERVEPEDTEPFVQKSKESLRELDQAVQDSQAARARSKEAFKPVEAPEPPPAQRD